MGKGDKKTKRGKIIMGSYGVRRPKRSKGGYTAEGKSVEETAKTAKPKEEAVKEKKKTATKKAVAEVKEEAVAETPKKKTSRKSEEKETEAGE